MARRKKRFVVTRKHLVNCPDWVADMFLGKVFMSERVARDAMVREIRYRSDIVNGRDRLKTQRIPSPELKGIQTIF